MYLDDRRDELADRTLSTSYYRLEQFCRWCDREGIDNLNDLRGRDLHKYKVYRRDEQGVAPPTLKGDFDTLRVFIEFCEFIEAAPKGLGSKISVPGVSRYEAASDDLLPTDRAEAVLDYLEQYYPASRDHALILLLWHVGMRVGGLRTIDLDDCDLTSDAPGIALRHRPDESTPLKNGRAGERDVNLTEDVADVLDEYVRVKRVDYTDEYERKPLFTTSQGRISDSAIRETLYRMTRPCMVGECPHDRDPDDCEAMDWSHASLCPDSHAPHDVRSGSITYQLNRGIPHEVVEVRVNASEEVIDQHYDRRTHRDKMQQRREHLEGL
jgi:integrase